MAPAGARRLHLRDGQPTRLEHHHRRQLPRHPANGLGPGERSPGPGRFARRPGRQPLFSRPFKTEQEPRTMPSDSTTSFATAIATIPRRAPARPVVGPLTRGHRITRRHLQVALGLFWLLDAALQAQPFMFTRGFATQVIAAVGAGQPGFVSAPVHWASTVIAAHPVAWNVPFAGTQPPAG